MVDSILEKLPTIVTNSTYFLVLIVLKLLKREELAVYFLILDVPFHGYEIMSYPEIFFMDDKEKALTFEIAFILFEAVSWVQMVGAYFSLQKTRIPVLALHLMILIFSKMNCLFGFGQNLSKHLL